MQQSKELGAAAIELHTGAYSHHPKDAATLKALVDSSRLGGEIGLAEAKLPFGRARLSNARFAGGHHARGKWHGPGA